MLQPYKKSQLLARNRDVSRLGGMKLSGYAKDSTGVEFRRRVLNRYCLVYVLRGEGTYSDSRGLTFDIKTHDAFISMPEVPHHYGPRKGETWNELYIIFEGPVFDLWRSQGFFNWPNPTVNLGAVEYWVGRFIETASQSNEGSVKKMMAETLRLQALLTDIFMLTHRYVEDDLVWLVRAKDVLAADMTNEEAAAALEMSYEAFRKKFRKLSGQSPGRYRTSVVMQSACELLEQTDLTIKSVAEKLKYCDEYHFSKQFSKNIGVSPSHYRAMTTSK